VFKNENADRSTQTRKVRALTRTSVFDLCTEVKNTMRQFAETSEAGWIPGDNVDGAYNVIQRRVKTRHVDSANVFYVCDI